LLVAAELIDRLAATMPRRRAVERLMTTLLTTMHLCADRARNLEAQDPIPAERWRGMSHQDFRTNLIDMALGACFAPATLTPPPLDPPVPTLHGSVRQNDHALKNDNDQRNHHA